MHGPDRLRRHQHHVHATIALQGPVPFPMFYTLVILAFFCIGFQGPNYNAIAMEPLGALAGSGAALIGFASSFVSASIGGLSPASSTARSHRSSSATAVVGIACPDNDLHHRARQADEASRASAGPLAQHPN
jgi:hypothetical protein